MTDAPESRRLTVLGVGYLGVTHAICMSEWGFEVLGVDTNEALITSLSAGELPFFEPGMETLLHRGLESGRLRFSISYQEAAQFGDVHFICVGTPQQMGSGHADLSQISACIKSLGPLLASPCLVVGKSTVPVGTAMALASELARSAPAGVAAELAWNPEFLREGSAVEDTLRPARIVIGSQSRHAAAILTEVYAEPLAAGSKLFVTDLATAELAKSAANSFLATKISFINAMAEVCEAASGDVTMLSDIIGSDPRIGSAFLRAGLGFGGGCLPKDIRAFMSRANELGVGESLAFLKEVDAVNRQCRARMVNLARELCGGSLAGQRVGILGLSFKPNSDDIRDSPALDVAESIYDSGACVTVYDPAAMNKARMIHPELEYAASAMGAAADADVLLLLTEWPELCEADPEVFGKAVARRRIADGRNALDPDLWRDAGWEYRALGQQASAASRSPRHPRPGYEASCGGL